ncbi:serine/threonine protein kinase [Calothrix rhizosoleniae]|uniref:serine/threonine protein kinase n=1 Tax=Calothrix rhizosoleniae TaxID=888997 RepID=UPI000B4A0CC0|nr:serine/threonine protein kinase [Calothrix rhizosoleniae]
MIGKILDYRYKLIRILATGGFGETYIAQDTKRPGNPICVVKHLKPSSPDDKIFATAKRLFNSEAETLEKLGNYDHIPRLLAYFVEYQEFYLVQEFIEGHPLSEELVPGKVWSEVQVIHLLQEVLAILKVVHSHEVIHRDIKPDNIIRRASDNKLVLVDFGAVKQLRSSHQSHRNYSMATVAIGTPGYMPTEQGQGKPRPNSDLYALGMIAIQALTGVSPIDLQEDPNTGEIIWQHLVSVNKDLGAILTKMVHYHFKDRYQSASQALEALQPLCTFLSPPEFPQVSAIVPRSGKSPHSQQKTLALAPANSEGGQLAVTNPPPVSQNPHRFDFLQFLILIGLAGGAAAITPTVVNQVKNIAASFPRKERVSKTCSAVIIANSYIRNEPTALYPDNIIKTVTNDTKFDVTGKRTKNQWVQLKIGSGVVAWAHADVIKNQEKWVSCLRDRGVAIKTVDEKGLVRERAVVQSQPQVQKTTTTTVVKPSPNPSLLNSSESSTKIFEQAKEKYESGNFREAIALLRSIPKKAADFKEAAAAMSQWQKDWKKAEALFNDINKALDDGQWERVKDYQKHPEKLPDIKYWRNKIEPLLKEAADSITQQQSSSDKAVNRRKNFIEKLLKRSIQENKNTIEDSKNTDN